MICNREESQENASVAFNGKNYIVVWSNWSSECFVAARVTPQGVVLDTGNYIGEAGFASDISFDGNRCFAVEWICQYEGSSGVYGRFVNSLAEPIGSVVEIAETEEWPNSVSPKIEFDNNNYLVVWADRRVGGTDYDIYGQFVSTHGQIIGGKINIATGSNNQQRPDLAFEGNNYLVVWIEGTKINGQWVAVDGQLIGANFTISENISYERYGPGVGSGTDNFLVTWGEKHGDFLDIYGNVDVQTGIDENISNSAASVRCGIEIYPNPCRGTVSIKFQIPNTNFQIPSEGRESSLSGTNSNSQTDLKIYDATGRLVKDFSLPTSNFPLPTSISWDGTDDYGNDLAYGVYFIKMEADGFEDTKKILMVR